MYIIDAAVHAITILYYYSKHMLVLVKQALNFELLAIASVIGLYNVTMAND